ncbi:hypothetical protein [Amycolatopsis orientalis]|uniref:hypothetical protein n=1 Tax=Amycolatopsis orientalis TaxID=31958 RepID=UPI0003F71A5A|nr:hypothetical protein [Amycolatopsis orientalis]
MSRELSTVRVRPRGRVNRRLLGSLVAVVAMSGAVGLAAGPASAAQTCTGAADSNLCLAINRLDNGLFAVHVGIDVHMSLDRAQEYIDDPGDPLRVTIRGDDSGKLAEFLFTVPLTALGASAGFGLSGDFDTVVTGNALNEDSGQDEVRAVVTLIDTDTNTVDATFVSNRITGNWP